jgi:hypothetical protein
MIGDMLRRTLALVTVLVAGLGLATTAGAAGRPDVAHWPAKDSMILIQNEFDQTRHLDGRTGHEPFDGTAPAADCNKKCEAALVACPAGSATCTEGSRVWGDGTRYLKLLGGHGNDVITGGPFTDVIWGDFKPSGQPTSQVDSLDGGAGRDYIYTSHGRNTVTGGPGDDYIVARFSRGTIDCGPGRDVVFVSKKSRAATKFTGCEKITHGPLY